MATIKDWLYENRATLMSWGATFGTIGGSILSARAVPKAMMRIHDAMIKKLDKALDEAYDRGASEEEINELFNDPKTELTLWEKIKAGGPAFIPAVVVEAATIGLIHGSNIENRKDITKARDALAVAAAGFAAYHESVGAITDRTTEFAAAKRVEQMKQSEANGDPPWDQKQLFRIEGRADIFEKTMEEVFEAEYLANRQFALKGNLTLNEFYKLFDLSEVHDELIYNNDGDCMGWEEYLGEVYYGYHWIDFRHVRKSLPDGRMVCEIQLPIWPHPLDEEVVDQECCEANLVIR